MEIFKKNWLSSKPIDRELKYYLLKGYIAKIEDLISNGKLYTAMSVVETELHKLYNIKYDRDMIELDGRIIVGINVDTMDLDYEYPVSSEEDVLMYEACDTAIDLLEKLYRKIRDFWRSVETKCLISEIPDRKPINSKGYVMYVNKGSDLIEVYYYEEPITFKMSWSDFNLKYVSSIDNNIKSISDFIAIKEVESNKDRFFRFDSKAKGYSKKECMIPLMKYMLFNRIKHGI